MKQKNLTGFYAVFQIVVWGSFGIIVFFASPFCLYNGLSNAQYGMLFALVAGLAFALQLGLAELSSRFSRLTLKRLLIGISLSMLLFCLGIFFLPLPVWLRITLYALTALLVQCLPPLVNALGVAGMQQGLRINFGLSRGIGSLGYAVLSFLTGQLVSVTTPEVVPILYTGMCVLLLVAACLFPRVDTVAVQQSDTPREKLLQDRRFVRFLAGATLLYICHNLLCNFVYQIVTDRGGAEAEQGITGFIAAVSELPVMFLFTKMLKKGRCDTWLKLSGLFIAGKVLVMLCIPGIAGVYGAQLMQSLGFSMFAVSSVYYVGSVIPDRQVVRGQAFLAATCALSNVVASLLGGWLVELWGVRVMLLSALVTGVSGALLLFTCLRRVDRALGT